MLGWILDTGAGEASSGIGGIIFVRGKGGLNASGGGRHEDGEAFETGRYELQGLPLI